MSVINFSFEHTPQYILLYGILCVFFLFDVQVLPIFIDLNVLMILFLSSIYYWSIYHPSLLPPWLLFCAGVLKDLITGLPFIGLSAIIYICVFIIVKQQRVFLSGQSFLMIWAGYLLVSLFACFIFWAFLCFYLFEFAPYNKYLYEGAIMVLTFPIMLTLMGIIHRFLPFASQDKASL